jgi:hypothetical protein
MLSAVPVSIPTVGYIGYSSSLPLLRQCADESVRPRIPTVGYIDYSSLLPLRPHVHLQFHT